MPIVNLFWAALVGYGAYMLTGKFLKVENEEYEPTAAEIANTSIVVTPLPVNAGGKASDQDDWGFE
jgi:hypothetical protein